MRYFGNLAFLISACVAIGFWLWAMACLVRAYAVAKQCAQPLPNVFSLSTAQPIAHPAYPDIRGFMRGMAGFLVSTVLGFLLSYSFGSIS